MNQVQPLNGRRVPMNSVKTKSRLKKSMLEQASWGYGTDNGPGNWGTSYSNCAGNEQSPIDIIRLATEVAAGPVPLKVTFKPAAQGDLQIVNNGHSVQVEGDGLKGDTLQLPNSQGTPINYDLQRFNFHVKSETRVDGKQFPLEVQFMYKAADGAILVMAVLFRLSSSSTTVGLYANPHLAALPWKGLAPGAKKPLAAFNPETLLPPRLYYWFYRGSLTTPPCTQGVKWVVLSGFQYVTADLVHEFPFKSNARPAQPLNGRLVLTNGVKRSCGGGFFWCESTRKCSASLSC